MRFISFLILFICFLFVSFGEAVPPAPHSGHTIVPKSRPSSGIQIYKPTHVQAPVHLRNAAVDTIYFAAIRIEFVQDNDPNTTGDGTFDLSGDNPDSIPHGYDFFDHICNVQMDAYYKQASYDQLRLQGTVFPPTGDRGYQVSREMGYYGENNDNGEEQLSRLCELFEEAILLADADADFSQYDAVMVFHAGVGEESGIEPKGNIWSQSLDFKTVKTHLGDGNPDYQGISTNDGVFVREAIIVPETQHREPYGTGTLGNLGVCVHEFGHVLGFADLYNTVNNSTGGIGTWGLMSYGLWNGLGFFPAHPSAWNRANVTIRGEQKSWIDIREINTNQENIELYQITSPIPATGRGEAIKIPINTTEYFLIENRQGDPNHNGHYDSDFEGVFFTDFYSVEFDFRTPNRFSTADNVSIPPPGGLLIYHVDDVLIEERIETNTLQSELPQAVDIEEADGSNQFSLPLQVVGDSTNLFRDPYSTDFNSFTNPNTNDNNGGKSSVQIYNIGISDSVMTFDVSFSTQSGWPRINSEPHSVYSSPLVVDLDGDGLSEVIAPAIHDSLQYGSLNIYLATGVRFATLELGEAMIRGTLAAGDINQDGTLEIVAGDNQGRLHVGGLWDFYDGTLFDFPQLSAEILAAPTLADITGDGFLELIICTTYNNRDSDVQADNVYVLDWEGNILWSKALHMPIDASPAIDDIDNDGFMEIIIADWNGELTCFEHDGTQKWQRQIGRFLRSSPAIGNLVRETDQLEVVIPDETGNIYALDANGEDLSGFPVMVDADPVNPMAMSPALADIDQDGYLEIILPNTGNVYHARILAINHTGGFVEEVMFRVVPSDFDAYWTGLRSSPVVADLDGDGSFEILVGTPDGRLFAWHSNGEVVDQFPYGTGDAIKNASVVVDLDNDGDTEVIASSSNGIINIWDLPGAYNPQNAVWNTFQANVQRTGSSEINKNLGNLNPNVTGSELMPPETVYCRPNPTNYLAGDYTYIHYGLTAAADVTIKIFDLAGDLIYETERFNQANDASEVKWNVANVASGVYICRVEAEERDGSRSSTEMIKIAVIR